MYHELTLSRTDSSVTINGQFVAVHQGHHAQQWPHDERDIPAVIEDEFGDLRGYTQYLITRFEETGSEFFHIGEVGHMGVMLEERDGEPLEAEVELLQDLDGITTWLGDRHDDEGKFLDMDGWFEREKIEFSYLYDFAEQHDLEFIPTVQPGFTEKHSDCYAYDEPRHVGRSLEFFKDMLELALEYQTMNRIHVASYNDWNEGHQIEPGWMPDEDYGFTYLEAIEARLEAADDTG